MASNCEKHPRPGCPDEITNITNITEENVYGAVALAASIPDLLPSVGNSRLDLRFANYVGHNAVGGTFMHNWDAEGTLFDGVAESVSIGVSAAVGEDTDDLFTIQAGIEF